MNEERITPMQSVVVAKLCAICGADMYYTGQTYLTAPPQYVHACSASDEHKTRAFRHQYPRTEMRPL